MKKEKNMKKEEIKLDKSVIIIGLVFLLAIIPLMMNAKKLSKNIAPAEEKENEYKIEEIAKETTINGVKFSNITLNRKDEQTTFKAAVTNITDKTIKTENFDIDLLDKNNKVLITLRANIPNGLKKNETKEVNASAKGDFKNAVYKAIKETK